MDLKQIKELMAAMERAGIKKLSIKEKTGFELQLERQGEESVAHSSAQGHYVPHYHSAPFHIREQEHHARFPTPQMTAQRPIEEEAQAAEKEKTEEKVGGRFVSSPMVGTLYSSPSPDDPPFIKVGDRVDENTVVCIIEAMKVMNEVKAGISGVLAEVYVDNAQPVEFGTKIFRIV